MGQTLNTMMFGEPKPDIDVKKVYWDAEGNLRVGHTLRNRDEEVIALLEADTNDDSDPTKVWMIVPSRWLKEWLIFAHLKLSTDAPGPIPMHTIMKQDRQVDGGWRPLKTLQPPQVGNADKNIPELPGHYRRISFAAWTKLAKLYDITEPKYAMAVRGTPYDDLSRWRVFKDPFNIDENLLPEPIIVEIKDEEGKEAEDGKKKGFLGLF